MDIASSLSPFLALPHHATVYPQVVVRALYDLFGEYNRAFEPLVEDNREWDSDYQNCDPPNFAVQIDMVGLPETLLDEMASMAVDQVREILRLMIFEMDSSLAMYQLLERLFPRDGQGSFFKTGWRGVLDDLRRRHRRPIALLAVTDDKYQAMAESEFGMPSGQQPTDTQVRNLSGFDAFLGPDQFRRLVETHGENLPYALYVRSSEPTAKLRKPGLNIDHPLLGDPKLRRLIKANALTINVDQPDGDPSTWINDTKAYMPALGLGYRIDSLNDLLEPDFDAYLADRGLTVTGVLSGDVPLRCKPLKASYGAYGHVRGRYPDKRGFRDEVKRNMRLRPGGYIVQPEMSVPVVTNEADGVEAAFIDRNFIGLIGGTPAYLGGFRNYMPVGSPEFRAGRIHGNGDARWGEIVPAI